MGGSSVCCEACLIAKLVTQIHMSLPSVRVSETHFSFKETAQFYIHATEELALIFVRILEGNISDFEEKIESRVGRFITN